MSALHPCQGSCLERYPTGRTMGEDHRRYFAAEAKMFRHEGGIQDRTDHKFFVFPDLIGFHMLVIFLFGISLCSESTGSMH